MAIKINSDLRKELLDSERLINFVATYEEYQRLGLTGAKLYAAALNSVAPDLASKYCKSLTVTQGVAVLAELKAARGGSLIEPKKLGRPRKVGGEDELVIHMDVHLGKVCSWSDAVSWAYVHSGERSPVEDEAPSALAWKLLIDFRNNPDYAQDIFKGVIVAKTKREEADSGANTDNYDGKAIYDLLGKLGEVGAVDDGGGDGEN